MKLYINKKIIINIFIIIKYKVNNPKNCVYYKIILISF